LQILPEHGQHPATVSQVRALVDHGLEGDAHGKKKARSRRQILVLDQRTLQELGLRPGDLREQITIDFPPLEALPPGTLLQIGQVTCELTGACEPCTHIGTLVGVPDAAQFQMSLQGRRGQLAKVTAVDREGIIRVGDSVAVIGARDPTPS
jgi:MOSC domain-containing protein YiiM